MVGMEEAGYDGAVYIVDWHCSMVALDVWAEVKLPVTTSQSQSAMPPGTVSTAVWGE